MPFESKKQSAWAFATGQPWAKEWADKTDYKRLPKKKLPYHVKKSEPLLVIKALGASSAVAAKPAPMAAPIKAPAQKKAKTPSPRVEVSLAKKLKVPKPKLLGKALQENAMQGGMGGSGNRITQIPAVRLFLDLDPYADHHGHGFWTGKFNPGKEQEEYEQDEQDVGRPALSVSKFFDTPPEDEDNTIKSLKLPDLVIKSGFPKSPAERTPKGLTKLTREPRLLTHLHGRPPRKAAIKFGFGSSSRIHRHPAVVIRTKKWMPRIGIHNTKRIRRTIKRTRRGK